MRLSALPPTISASYLLIQLVRLLNDPVQTDGRFVYKAMRPGVYILTGKRLGYATAPARIEILADHRVIAVAVMVPQVVRLVE